MSSIPKQRILVVDDESGIRETVAMMLASAGYDVSTARDGFGALMRLRHGLPDVIISDLNMPQMSGYELLSVIRRRFPQILTVAMSGAYQGDAVPSGVIADSFFAKGQSPKNLLAMVEALIRKAEAWVGHQRQDAPAWVGPDGKSTQRVPRSQ